MDPAHDLKKIYYKAIKAVDPFDLVTKSLGREGDMLSLKCGDQTVTEDLSRYESVIVLGVGKGSCEMARAVEHILGETISRGVVITKYGQAQPLKRINVLEAGHPVPDENSIEGALILARLAQDAGGNTLIINLISGGGSSLLCLPSHGITLKDKQETTRLLLESGAVITEINCIRKHISRVKGGNLARIAYPARMINLILSDVVGDRLDTIASGITEPDPTTFGKALGILKKYRLEDRIPVSVKQTLESGAAGAVPETPKDDDPVFGNIVNMIMGNNYMACKEARACGRELGYNAKILTASLTGEAREIAGFFSALARDIESDRSDIRKPALLIAGGETTVTIRGSGKGGRNQEMVLAFFCNLLDIHTHPELRDIFFLSAGTDGNDGPTDAAGAIMTPGLEETIRKLRLDPFTYLANNDSYHFFEKTGSLFKTGLTNTNVCDIQLLIVM
jgi:hydroxypyruvate reductase